MADIRNLPIISTLPRWAYNLLALACICMGLWASYITLQYFEHGARALEADPALQALAVSAALMFVASEMGAFTLASLLTEAQLWARRWMLTGFAVAVLALEVITIVAVQLALTTGADMTQSNVATSVAGLQKQIDAVEKNAAAFAATAEALRAEKQVSKAMKASDKAAAEQAKTAALYDELKRVQAQKRPTLVGLLGEKYALIYAIARGILVSLGGLVFFGTAGALMRVARGAAGASVSVPGTVPPGALVASALASFKPAGTVAPKDATGFSYSSKLAGAGALGALGVIAAPMAHAAPAAPVIVDIPAPANMGTPAALDVGALTSSKPVNDDIPSPVIVDIPDAPKKARKPRQARDGAAVMDTGVGEHDGYRYRRAVAGVKSGKIRPSIAGLYKGVEVTAPTARRFLLAMSEAGVIVRAGRGWARV